MVFNKHIPYFRYLSAFDFISAYFNVFFLEHIADSVGKASVIFVTEQHGAYLKIIVTVSEPYA